ncbi:MAG: hypothetical protein KDJ65_34270 [Anaerolineae bacterium]|nr:hypothetical protein [Anaerolineae bacterium]
MVSFGEQRFWENYQTWKETHQEYNITRDLLRVNWKSDKYREMKYGNGKLTSGMRSTLRNLLVKKEKKPNSRTFKALNWRRLANENGELSEHGRVLALSQLSLKRQCQLLNLPLFEWNVSTLENPENTVQSMLEQQGSQSYFVENTFCLFIDYVMGNALLEVAEKLGKHVYTLDLTYDPEIFFFVKKDLEKYLNSLNENHCIGNFPVCKPFLGTIFTNDTPQQILTLFDKIFRSLGVDRVKKLLRMYFSNPLAYSYRGWPDLFVIEKQNAYCIEVKTTDKLHLNQLVTIPDLVVVAGLSVHVVKLTLRK